MNPLSESEETSQAKQLKLLATLADELFRKHPGVKIEIEAEVR